MSSKHVIIEISPSRVEAYIRRGGAGAMERLTPGETAEAGRSSGNASDSGAVGPTLARIVTQLGLSGAAATVLYSGAITNVISLPPELSAADADAAAALALAGLADFPPDEHPNDCVHLGRDVDGGDGMRQHLLAAADREERLSELAGVVRAAGLVPTACVPAEAAAMAQAVAAARFSVEGKGNGAGGSRAAIWLGEHFTVVAATAAGRLAFVRLTGTGLESFVDALTRPIRPKDPAADPITLDRKTAIALLASAGVPTANQMISVGGGIEGAAVLPLLSPVIQRLASEVKQSLRFGVAESQRTDLTLKVIGPGSLIPGLPSIIARQCGLTLEESPSVGSGSDTTSSATHGVIAAYLEHERNLPRLLPRAIEGAAAVRRARATLVAGTLLAAAWMGYEYTSTHQALGSATARLAVLNAQMQDGVADSELRERAIAARLAAIALEQRVQTTLGSIPDWPAIMTVLADAAPPEVKLTAVDLDTGANSNGCTILGYVRSDRPTETAGVIRRLIGELRTHPLIESVRLGTTQRVQVGGQDCQEFELIVTPIAVPVVRPAEVADGHSGTSRRQEGGS